MHFILEVKDKGTPALTRYQRVIVNVIPKWVFALSMGPKRKIYGVNLSGHPNPSIS
jgi:hypothetical protein